MTKKTIITSSIVLLTLFVVVGISNYNTNKKTLAELIPLLPQLKTVTKPPTPKPTVKIIPNTQTNPDPVTKQVPPETSVAEIEKITDLLPIRLNDFSTKAGLKTTINVYKSVVDENSILRMEIYGINYYEQSLTGPNALAFKESFQETKKYFPKDMVLKNTQIIYGNRQYIQDTATYWTKEFKLLD